MSNDNENDDEISLGALFFTGATIVAGILFIKDVKDTIDKHRENKQRRRNRPSGPAIASGTSTTGPVFDPASSISDTSTCSRCNGSRTVWEWVWGTEYDSEGNARQVQRQRQVSCPAC